MQKKTSILGHCWFLKAFQNGTLQQDGKLGYLYNAFSFLFIVIDED